MQIIHSQHCQVHVTNNYTYIVKLSVQLYCFSSLWALPMLECTSLVMRVQTSLVYQCLMHVSSPKPATHLVSMMSSSHRMYPIR